MRSWWELWPQGLSSDYCDALVARAQQLPAAEAPVNYGTETRDSPQVRRSITRWFAAADGQDPALANDIMFFARKANRNSFGFELTEPFGIQFAEYHGTDSGGFDWHQDVNWLDPAPSSRKLSFVAQLSDPNSYEGGDFEFNSLPSPGPEFRNKGAVLVFPSFLYHRVAPVTSGVRHSLVSWVEGPNWR